MDSKMLNTIGIIAEKHGFEKGMFAAVIEVETGGKGFDDKTGKIIIQFEPGYFKRLEPFAPSGAWSINKVDVQEKEWIAFNNAFKIDKESAMRSTSIGAGQIMGEHFKRLGFKTVGEMWDYSKKSLENQIDLIARFIKTDKKLYKAFMEKDFHLFAYYYNGPKYKEMAVKWGREPYNISIKKAEIKYSKYFSLSK